MDEFAKRLLTWYDDHGRHDLPWQRDATPYHVWLSEIMLQQTQVATVIPYYERFIASFPDIQALASADLDQVLRHWSGLGYYARARNLHKAAKMLATDFAGEFSADIDALQSLPGVGRSTAGAILSTALNGRAAILDGNVKRVLARFHAVEGWPGKTAVASQLWELAEEHTPASRVADYTQAIMDLGATLCTRSKPACERCPVAADCVALRLEQTRDFPGRKPKKAIPTKQTHFVIAHTPDGELLLERRPSSGIWGGLWCFPEVDDAASALRYCEETLAAKVDTSTELALLRHSFSHYHLEISPLLLTLSRTPTAISEQDQRRFWPANELPTVGLAAPVKRLWQQAALLVSKAQTGDTE
jgi:A/G-specific adenine glycosylase